MKTIAFVLFACLSIAFSSCDDTSTALLQGQIIGPDVGVCPCCGGYMIIVNKFTYRFFETDLPTGSTILTGASFPMDVELEFKGQNTPCNDIERITISKINKL